jgi:acetoin utilization protein AcuB
MMDSLSFQTPFLKKSFYRLESTEVTIPKIHCNVKQSFTDEVLQNSLSVPALCAMIAVAKARFFRMIVKEIMTTELITVAPDDTLGHAANLLRQYQFHHLPVVRGGNGAATWHWPREKREPLIFEGLLTSQDIDMAVALERENGGPAAGQEPWQSRRVVEVMHRALIRVTPSTTVAAAALLLVERNLNCLPVIQYETAEPFVQAAGESASEAGAESASRPSEGWQESRPLLVGLLTRSDLLTALARSLGVFEPGMQLVIPLRHGNMHPLARVLTLADELRIGVRSVVAAPLQGIFPRAATLRLGTINPAPLLLRLQEEGIAYSFVDQEV